ncbi:MAG: serine/threonine-protein phosphatase [Planctomycetes bacterium]|nr:serine/threonine-protein phosphatase [Planctomycetota bacterium]
MSKFLRRRIPGRRPGAGATGAHYLNRNRRDRRVMQKTVSNQNTDSGTIKAAPSGQQKSITRNIAPREIVGSPALEPLAEEFLDPASGSGVMDPQTGSGLQAIATEQQIEEFGRDVLAARELQIRMLPSRPPKIFGYEVTAFYDACDVLAGDFFQFVNVSDGQTGFLVADVSGHGLTAAMLMAATLKTFSFHARGESSPRKVLHKVFTDLRDDLPPGRFITAFYAVLDHASGTLRYARAGHNPAYLWHPERNEIQELKETGVALGLGTPELFESRTEEGATIMPRGAALLLYSDGITEAHNPQGEQFGEERLRSLFAEIANLRSRPLVEQVINALREHTTTDFNEDDLTLVVLKRE